MKPIPFDANTDLAPIPFDQEHLELARDMKQHGLEWKPHVGCFVWDPKNRIEAESPFPLRVYFILSLPRFINIFGSIEKVAEKLVWLPTWHQARLVAVQLGVEHEKITSLWSHQPSPPGNELLDLYRLIRNRL